MWQTDKPVHTLSEDVSHFVFWTHAGKKLVIWHCMFAPSHPRSCRRPMVYMCMWEAPAAVVGPPEVPNVPLDSFDWQHGQDTAGPQPTSTAFLFSLVHVLRLPLFHALSSHNNVGGAELEYLEFLWAPLSGICPLLGCRKFSSRHWGITG